MDTFNIVEATITLSDGTRWLNCEVFLPTGDRLSDVVNDTRNFLPIKKEGKEFIIRKDQIIFLTEN